MILTGETEVLGETLVPVPLLRHIPHMEGPGIECGLVRWEVCDWLESWRCQEGKQIATEMCMCV
jgi:hypothetical protein